MQARRKAVAWKIATACLWGVVLAAAFATTTPRPLAFVLIGMASGAVSGSLRARAIATDRPARVANALVWLGATGLLVLAMAFAANMFAGAWVAAVAGCLLVDCACSLPAGIRRTRRAEQPDAERA